MIPPEAIRIVVPHDKNCDWHESMVDRVEPTVRRDRLGRKVGINVFGTVWLNVRCNNTTCPAQIIIREQDLLKDVIGT